MEEGVFRYVPNHDRQASLRRVDWRFLLPAPDGVFQHLVLLGGTARLAERMLAAGIARRISLTLPGNHSADAVAVLHDSPKEAGVIAGVIADAIAGSLAPGGVVYYEVDRRSAAHVTLTPGRLMGRLRKASLVPTGIYWAAPDFEHCKRYIPLDIPEAFQWYLSTLYEAGTPLYSLIERCMRLYTRFDHHRFAPLAPCYAVTAKIKPVMSTAPSVLGHPELPAELQQPDLRPAVLTSGQDDGSRAVLLPFAPGRSQPLAVFKISTFAGVNTNTMLEQTRLNEIRGCLDRVMRGTVPRPLGLICYGGSSVSIESYADGHSISVSSGRWRVPLEQQIADLRLAADWLSEFHRQAQVGRVTWDEQAIERWIELPLAKYSEAFGLTPQEECLFNRVRNQSATLSGASIPLVRLHYDFGPWNLYRSENGLTVIDWEFGRNWDDDRFGPSLYDLLYFVTHWIHLVNRAYHLEAELRAFYGLFVDPNCRDPYVKAAHAVLAEYSATHEIDRRLIPLMLVYVWVEQALYQVKRKRALGARPADHRLNNHRVMRLGMLAEHAEQFFARMSGYSPAQ